MVNLNIKSLLGLAIVLGLAWYVLIPYVGAIGSGLAMLLVFGSVLFGAKALKINTAVSSYIPMKNAKTIAVVLFVGAMFMTGALAQFGLPTASQLGAIGGTPTETFDVSTELFGKSATLNLKCFDNAGATRTDIGACPVTAYDSAGKTLATNSGVVDSVTTTAGNSINLYAGNSSYYCNKIEGIEMTVLEVFEEMECYAIIDTETNADTSAFDEDGNALTTGTTNEEDFEITLSADEKKAFELKWKQGDTDTAYWFAGWAVITNGDVQEVLMTSDGFTKVVTPLYLDNKQVSFNTTQANNLTSGYDYVYRLDEPVLLLEFDSLRHELTIKASASGTDARDGSSSDTLSDLAIFMAVDAQWEIGKDGKMYFDFYQHDDSEGNVGEVETVISPYGDDMGCIIEAV